MDVGCPSVEQVYLAKVTTDTDSLVKYENKEWTLSAAFHVRETLAKKGLV